jgi:hypothetical protein
MDRRTFLRGAGTLMALPFLEAMAPTRSLASIGSKTRPNRVAFIFVPNGIHMQDWKPAADGALTEMPWILDPLKPLQSKLNILTGLTQRNAFALGDGPGDHARSTAAWLTGCKPRKTAGADIKNGISIDQLIAQNIGKQTRFPSLEIGCERGAQAGNCDSGYSCAYSSNVSWSSESTPVAKEVNPRLVFERLFGNGDSEEEAENRARRNKYRKSILDFVMEDAAALKGKLGSTDQKKLDEYFTGVREVERRLTRLETDTGVVLDAVEKPTGIPADFGEHIRLMSDMMVLAFQADLTRVCTFMYANDGSNRNYKMIDITDGHHELSHHGRNPEKQEKIRRINRFHIEQLARMLQKMDAIKEGDGNSLLDNSMIVYGAGISDGDRHNHDDLPILLAGRGGGTLQTGRHVVYPNNTPMTNLFLSMSDRMGVRAEKIGDSTGKLDRLFTPSGA